MTFRVAAVSFLNTLPLIEWFSLPGCENVVLSRALPSRLADLLGQGDADVALLPVVEVFRGKSGGIIPGTGIACRGAVDSVKLFCMDRPDQLELIRVDRGSKTSVALLKVLLMEKFKVLPEFRVEEPVPGRFPEARQGILVIGDRCFEYEKSLAEGGSGDLRGYDLGAMWHELTGLPFVFAIWAMAPGLVDSAGPEVVPELASLLGSARDYGLENLSQLAQREASAGRLGHRGQATAEAIDYYFRYSLRYHLGAQEMAGMNRFHAMCLEYGIVPEGEPPLVLEGR